MESNPARCVLLLAVLFLTAACRRTTFMHHYEHVSSEGWARTDTLRFRLPEVRDSGDYLLDLGMRYTATFPYRGVWVVAETRLCGDSVARRDTLYFAMADETGAPVTEGVSLLQHESRLTTLPLCKGDSPQIHIRHIMNREVIPGIREVGLRASLRQRP